MTKIENLVERYREFYQQHYADESSELKVLAEHGQSPEVLIIACSDSRVDPSIITKANLGEMFVIRNVANLVPPYSPSKNEFHGTSAAIEFAVKHLHVKHIVVMGHSRCAGIRALMSNDKMDSDEYSYIRPWVKIATKARDKILKMFGDDPIERQIHECSKEALKISLENLKTFPWISEKIKNGELQIHGWHFSLKSGYLKILDQETGEFERVIQ